MVSEYEHTRKLNVSSNEVGTVYINWVWREKGKSEVVSNDLKVEYMGVI